MKNKWWLSTILILFLSGCSSQFSSTATLTPLVTDTSTPIPTATQTSTPTATAVPLISGACSPLQGIALTDLSQIISYKYYVKYPFSEGPTNDKNHPAVDLGFYHFKEYNTDIGHPIQAFLPGKVVEALDNRYPYGNMILIETPLTDISPDLIAKIKIPTPYSDAEIKTRSTCQPDQSQISWSQTDKSIYILYAHMQNPSALKAGDAVSCGEVIGAVGATGHAVAGNEHLHLEIREGPSDAKFGVIADYDASATTEERYNYCIWALSEVFQPIDPTLFWASSSNQDQ